MVPSFAPQAVGSDFVKLVIPNKPPFIPLTLKVAVDAPELVNSTEAGFDIGAKPFMAR